PLPFPADAKLILSGFALAKAINSWSVETGTFGLTTSTYVVSAKIEIGTKALASKGSFGLKSWLVTKDDGLARSVCPSGSAFETTCAPRLPEAPGRFSTITG